MLQDLPPDVARVLPSDPYAQIQLANQIINHAHTQKVMQMDAEAGQLREAVISKQATIKSLERRVGNLEAEVLELQAKNKAAVEDQHKLLTEKSALIETVKKLNRENSKLEAFKKSLIQHLQEEEDEPSQMARSLAAVDLNSERLVADVLNSATKQHGTSAAASGGAPGYPSKPGPSPAVTSTSGRNVYGGSGSPRHYHNSQSPPAYAPPAPPSHSQQQQQPYQGQGGGGSPQAMDGKEFFRQARARLSYEQFSLFLNAIKDLNAGRHTRDDTLTFVKQLCGAQHADLYALFEGLLSRHMSGF